MTRIALALTLALAVAGCARLNPLGWFDGGNAVAVPAPDATMAIPDPRPLVPDLAAIEVQATSIGAILRATAVTDRQGYWDAALVPLPQTAPDELRFAFVANPPAAGLPAPTQRSREVTAATELTERELFGIRRITVLAAGGGRSVGR